MCAVSIPLQAHVVVHVADPVAAVEQCVAVADSGLRSVFLIDHLGRDPVVLFSTAVAARRRCPSLEIGLNVLTVNPVLAAEVIAAALEVGDLDRLDAFWCDDVTGGDASGAQARDLREMFAAGGPLARVTLFGGVAFKYTDSYTDDPARAAAEAVRWSEFVDVVTTSGPGTNSCAEVGKVAAVAAAVPDGKRVGLASGVSPENLGSYAPYCSDVLVASSLETGPYSGVFVPARLTEMAGSLRAQQQLRQ